MRFSCVICAATIVLRTLRMLAVDNGSSTHCGICWGGWAARTCAIGGERSQATCRRPSRWPSPCLLPLNEPCSHDCTLLCSEPQHRKPGGHSMEAVSRLPEAEPLAPTPSASLEQIGSEGQWHASYCCESLRDEAARRRRRRQRSLPSPRAHQCRSHWAVTPFLCSQPAAMTSASAALGSGEQQVSLDTRFAPTHPEHAFIRPCPVAPLGAPASCLAGMWRCLQRRALVAGETVGPSSTALHGMQCGMLQAASAGIAYRATCCLPRSGFPPTSTPPLSTAPGA